MANGAVEANLEVGDAEVGMTEGGNATVVDGEGRAEDAKARVRVGEL
jgi:hypothetical protein